MELWMVAAVLLVLAVLVYLYSFTQKEEKEEAYKELEEFSLAVTKTVFDLNERVESVETELDLNSNTLDLPRHITQLSKDNIITLFTEGFSTETISKQLSIASTSVQEIIDTYVEEGIRA